MNSRHEGGDHGCRAAAEQRRQGAARETRQGALRRFHGERDERGGKQSHERVSVFAYRVFGGVRSRPLSTKSEARKAASPAA
jgi:hypothetical protein